MIMHKVYNDDDVVQKAQSLHTCMKRGMRITDVVINGG